MKGRFKTSLMYLSVQLPLGQQVCNKTSSLKYSSISLTHKLKTATSAVNHDSYSEAYYDSTSYSLHLVIIPSVTLPLWSF